MGGRPIWPKDQLLESIWKQHESGLGAHYDLLAAVGQALRGLPSGWEPRSVQKVVVIHLFVRAFKTTQAIHVLFLNGFAQDAQSLLRSLTEGVIDLFFILKKPGPRARQFADYTVIGRHVWQERLKNDFSEIPIPPDLAEKVEKAYAKLLTRRPDYTKLSRNWSTTSLRKRALEANSKNLYFYYLLACQMLHTDPRSVSSYLRPGQGMDDGPSVPLTNDRMILETAFVCLLDAFRAANEIFAWRRGDIVKEYTKRFRREFGDRSKQHGS